MFFNARKCFSYKYERFDQIKNYFSKYRKLLEVIIQLALDKYFNISFSHKNYINIFMTITTKLTFNHLI